MKQTDYLTRIATARSTKSSATSEDAYAQVDRMAKSTNGPFMTKASVGSSHGRKKPADSSKDSKR
ncbi:MAG: hypothetical protein V4689_22075 [Verrucomicrobiota bacterium]